jgi:hypothetical protein
MVADHRTNFLQPALTWRSVARKEVNLQVIAEREIRIAIQYGWEAGMLSLGALLLPESFVESLGDCIGG